jgi:hypothetical protein
MQPFAHIRTIHHHTPQHPTAQDSVLCTVLVITKAAIKPTTIVFDGRVIQVIDLLTITSARLNASFVQDTIRFFEVWHPWGFDPQIAQQLCHLYWLRVLAIKVDVLKDKILNTRLRTIGLITIMQKFSFVRG